MNEATALLFDEYATAYRRGEAPDVLAYLERAGDDRDGFADLVDRFLQSVPAREPTEEEIVLAHARLEQESPLLVLRLRRKLARDAVVDAIVRTLGLDPTKRDKVGGYYHELEVGLLDPKPVSSRVWDVLGDFLQANVRALAGIRPTPAASPLVRYLRAESIQARMLPALHEKAADYDALAEPASPPTPERDEIDRLFTGSA